MGRRQLSEIREMRQVREYNLGPASLRSCNGKKFE